VLALNLGGSGLAGFSNVLMAPGVSSTIERQFVVASRNGVAVPLASLRMQLENLVGTENGCDSNSEEAEQLAATPPTSCDGHSS
jgi:hypothetical protein